MNSKTTLMNAEVYEALISVKVPEEKAKAAAESVVIDERFKGVEEDIAALKTDMRWVKWFQGATTTMVMVAGVKYLFA